MWVCQAPFELGKTLDRHLFDGKYPNPRTVHQIDLGEIEEDLGAAVFDQIVNSATKRQTRCSETNIPRRSTMVTGPTCR